MSFIVLDGDCDSGDAVALYEDGALAKRHAEWIGGWVTELSVSTTLPVEVDDPIEVERRAAERELARERYRIERAEKEEAHQRKLAFSIDDVRVVPKLCHCCTFSSSDDGFITPNGYCTYCGGFTMETIRGKYGETVLQQKIDELALHTREHLRGILAGTRKPGFEPLTTAIHIICDGAVETPGKRRGSAAGE